MQKLVRRPSSPLFIPLSQIERWWLRIVNQNFVSNSLLGSPPPPPAVSLPLVCLTPLTPPTLQSRFRLPRPFVDSQFRYRGLGSIFSLFSANKPSGERPICVAPISVLSIARSYLENVSPGLPLGSLHSIGLCDQDPARELPFSERLPILLIFSLASCTFRLPLPLSQSRNVRRGNPPTVKADSDPVTCPSVIHV